MAVFRINKDNNYSVMSNYHLRDKSLSLKAMGLLTFMLSNDEGWDYSVKGLVSCAKDGDKSVESAIKELKKAGYLRVTKLYANETESGRIEYIYDIYEVPQILDPQKVPLEFLGVEKDSQRNIKKRNTKKEDKLDKLDKTSVTDIFQNELFSKLNALTIQLVERKFIVFSDLDLFRYDEFLSDQLVKCTSTNDYKNLVIVIGYVIAHMKEKNINSQFAYFKKSIVENLNKIESLNNNFSSADLYSEEYCEKLLEELNSINNELVELDEKFFTSLEDLYDSITENNVIKYESVP